MAKDLRIAWDTQIPNSYDQFTDNPRILGGPVAKKRESVDGGRLVDSDRTIQGSIGRAPSKGETKVPDDHTGIFQRYAS